MRSPKNQRIIQIDITNACTHRCSNCTRMCGHHKQNFFMDFETFKRAVDSLDGYVGTIGIMGGEPTLHPEFEKFAKYLGEHISVKKDVNNFIYPQKNFMHAIHNQELENTIPYDYETGTRETVVGAGLWSSMVDTYKKNYEIIQDTFRMQALNDHGNASYHSPILISRKELGIPDDEWIKMRDDCWMQNIWSATVTPKGAFFCEVAGALDMLFNGPGGWPIEPGWWKRTPEEFGEQLQWCEICGLALDTFSRDANEEIDDVSPMLYEKLKEVGSLKVKKGEGVHVIKIKDGKLAEAQDTFEHRKEHYWQSYESRFSAKSILYPDGFEGIQLVKEKDDLEQTVKRIQHNAALLDRLVLITDSDEIKEKLLNLSLEKVSDVISYRGCKLGYAIDRAMDGMDKKKYLFMLSGDARINADGLEQLKTMVINPGTMHVVKPGQDKLHKYILGEEEDSCAVLFSLCANAIKEMGRDHILNTESIDEFISYWNKKKVIPLTEDMEYDCADSLITKGGKYILYGTGGTGKSMTEWVNKLGASVLYYVNSFEEEQGKIFMGKEVKAPEAILETKDYDKIVIATNRYFMEIKNKLKSMGIADSDIVIPIE